MNVENLPDYFARYTQIEQGGLDAFIRLANTRAVKKNGYLIKAGEKPANLILILSGCLMTYLQDREMNPHVLQFGIEEWWTGDLEAFAHSGASGYSIKAMLDSEVLELPYDAFNELCSAYSGFERLFRIIFQNSLVSHQKRIMRNISASAEERYDTFRTNYPKLELIIPQKYIASYLGITPEFLSKLRSRRK
jgi:CRP-like cAMP-binding protein